jgi:aspartate/tyrosine/aromatic aminotransferase
MPTISITEKDFAVLANAAVEAFMNGDKEDAEALDKIARKMNAALSSGTASKAAGIFSRSRNVSWKEMPSTLEHLSRRDSTR